MYDVKNRAGSKERKPLALPAPLDEGLSKRRGPSTRTIGNEGYRNSSSKMSSKKQPYRKSNEDVTNQLKKQ